MSNHARTHKQTPWVGDPYWAHYNPRRRQARQQAKLELRRTGRQLADVSKPEKTRWIDRARRFLFGGRQP